MSTEPRPDLLVGRKLPSHALWEQLQRRAHPLALEFCSAFFNNDMTYAQARKWLEEYGIKISKTSLQGFYNSMDMRMRFASLQAEQSAELAKTELPADLEQATRERIAQHKFELAFTNLSEQHKLQLIQIQQNEEGMKGSFALKKAKLDLDRAKFERETCALFLKWRADKESNRIAELNVPNEDKIQLLRKHHFSDVDELEKSGKVQLPK